MSGNPCSEQIVYVARYPYELTADQFRQAVSVCAESIYRERMGRGGTNLGLSNEDLAVRDWREAEDLIRNARIVLIPDPQP